MEKETEILYKKVDRKYVPVAARWYEERHSDQMQVGTFRLTYAYSNGGRRYEYDVTPATAPMFAAMLVAKQAIDDAIREAVKMRPDTPKPYTKKQLAIIEQFKKRYGRHVSELVDRIKRIRYFRGCNESSNGLQAVKSYNLNNLRIGLRVAIPSYQVERAAGGAYIVRPRHFNQH
jgi:hypothetical protein